VAVKIKLKRMGKIREPYYRIIVADARTKRDGRAIEEIGKYHPKADPSFIEVNSDRAQHWLSVGAQPTDPVRKILEITGDWQKFKGLPGAEGTLRSAGARTDKKETFAAALAETLAEGAAAPKGRARAGSAKSGDAKSGDAKSGDAKSGDAKSGGAKSGDAKDAKDAKSSRTGRAGSGKAKADKAESGQTAAAGDAAPATAQAEVTAEAAEQPTAAANDETAAAETTAAAEPGSGD
jgi:small subunit ribosomal protein S16